MIKAIQFGLEGLLALLVLIFAYTQLVRPLMRKTPVFPMFRRRQNLERAIEDVNADLEEKGQQNELENRKRKLDGNRKPAQPAKTSERSTTKRSSL